MSAITYQGIEYKTNAKESVLDVLLRHDVDIPHSCKSGVCNSCVMVAEQCNFPRSASRGLKEVLVEQGYFLACQCFPKEPLVVSKSNNFALFNPATVMHKDMLTPLIGRLKLRASEKFDYHAGQYINLRKSNDKIRSYSLASLPLQDDYLELHIKRMPNGLLSNWLLDKVSVGDTIDIQGSFGTCYYQTKNKESNMLMIATGTGLAPLIGILRDAIDNEHQGEIQIYHGDSDFQSLYLHKQLESLMSQYRNIRYFPCVTGNISHIDNKIFRGRASDYAFTNNTNLKGFQVYLCGSPAMVASARKQAYLFGAEMANIHTDSFITNDLRKNNTDNVYHSTKDKRKNKVQ